jgi:hypothetical protein
MLNWNMGGTNGGCSVCEWTGSITWYHTSTDNVFGAKQSATLSPSSSYGGSWYSYVATPL